MKNPIPHIFMKNYIFHMGIQKVKEKAEKACRILTQKKIEF